MDRAEDEMALDRRKRTTPAAVFGNYSNYYVKRADDLRYQLISPHLSGDILDIGCNSGRDTIKIAQSNGVRFITGIDIDQKLISDCERALKQAWSLQSPVTALGDSQASYFPKSMPRLYGNLPIPPKSFLQRIPVPAPAIGKGKGRAVAEEESTIFPRNIRFQSKDFMADLSDVHEKYDVILALSITKWIHLHHLSSGLLSFFQKIHSILAPEGILILEPQPFSTYGKAARFSETLKTNFDTLKGQEWHDSAMEVMILQEAGFSRKVELGLTGEGGFQRPVDIYYK